MERYKQNAILTGMIIFVSITCGMAQKEKTRITTSLNGVWPIAQTNSFNIFPTEFNRKAQIPGLIDMANPQFDTTDDLRDKVYWYKLKYVSKNNAEIVRLKVYKAMYHTKIFINGYFAVENMYSFTPTELDIKKFLKKGNKVNEILIAVGCQNNLPDTVANGNDFEKLRYIPGIYDQVEIIESGFPFIENVQIVPNVNDTSIRVIVRCESGSPGNREKIIWRIRELASGKIVDSAEILLACPVLDFHIKISAAIFWSPETPFLYTLELKTRSDNKIIRFGIRSFEFQPGKSYALLNKKPYYLRGTNVTIMRFFEDPERANLPWTDPWVINLHLGFKDFYFNSMRYCIGFPPERWYEIADSLGIMIDDEFPVWGINKNLKGEMLAIEYKKWMEERWNHPSVVIWDAQNETITAETGKAIQLVRKFDLSNRPWDNGYSAPVSTSDPIESHPYLFVRYFDHGEIPSSAGALEDKLSGKKAPMNSPNEFSVPSGKPIFENTVIINEYSWLWLNRNGTTTTLTDRVYKTLFGDSLNTGQRLEQGARYTAMLTEYWRSYRTSAGVMHFCGLGYSRPFNPRGQTSDNFLDIKSLTYEPNFVKFVKPAFAPVGVMLDMWYSSYRPNETVTVPVHIINDNSDNFNDSLYLELIYDNKVIQAQSSKISVPGNGKSIYQFMVPLPSLKGPYELIGYYYSEKKKVFSARKFVIN